MKIFFLSLSLLILPISLARAEAPVTVRVMVEESQELMRLEIKGEYRIRLLPTLQEVKKGASLQKVAVTATPKGIRVDGQEWPARGIRVEAMGERDIYLDTTRYRGAIEIQKDKTGKLFALSRLDIESYMYGVLQHEVPYWWPMEALKAQAVAARTYAMYQAQVNKAGDYDLKSDTSSQMYGGSTTERFRTKTAVDQTRGQVLTYQGKIFPTYFHATCAGVTAGAQEIWKINLPPISGMVHCGYCRFSPHYSWNSKVSLAEVEEKLNKSGRPVGQVLKIEIISQTPSGRVGSLKITGISGEAVIAAKDFRIWIGGDRMKSTLFTVNVVDDMAEFHGKGWGHGVGLCQWGTLGQALLGHKYEAILKFYYPGADITRQ